MSETESSGEATGEEEAPVVELDNAEIVYDRNFLAVQGVSMKADRGDIVALLGPNGAGKSTILKMISGIGRSERGEVTRGDVYYEGEKVTNFQTKEMVDRGVTHILEGRRVFPDLTVEENLRCGLYREGRRIRYDKSDYELAFEY
ncbi:MAG: ATP-binding cassette domain-containing protein, partial [Natronomonas sp.]|nr:ATP-binding cassette domain-containing protein [Natronomonas sp.]